MGSGKSTIGKLLAQKLNYTFLDSDTWIEQEQGMSISDIFEKKGEKYFRKIEKQFIKNYLLHQNKIVLATGGGMPCFGDNISSLLEFGCVFNLNIGYKTLIHRLANDQNRPLLKSSTPKTNKIKQLLDSRREFYSQAHYTIRANREIYKIVQRIINLYSKH